jgi:hypothetical protein
MAPVATELEAAEDRWVLGLGEGLPPDTEPRALLFGPGSSKTDPLYALRFLAKLSLITGRPGRLSVFDYNTSPLIAGYYAGIPGGSHRVELEFGKTGNFERLRGRDAHMILAIHPSTPVHELFSLFARNLVRGGIGIVQAGVNEEFRDGDMYDEYLRFCLETCGGDVALTEPPIRSRLFRSFFAERSPDVHVLAVRKR